MNIDQLLVKQDITHPDSATIGFDLSKTIGIDQEQLSRFPVIEDPMLEPLKNLLEFGYGYRLDDKKKRYRRAAASAGAMYPIDIYALVTVNDQLSLLIYDFVHHHFRQVKALNETEMHSSGLTFDPTAAYLLIHANFEQTIQRYGLRGYRYCNIDAGHIICNLLNYSDNTVQVLGSDGERGHMATTLNLSGLLSTLYVPIDQLPKHDAAWPTHPVEAAVPFVYPHPYLSQNLTTITNTHWSFLNSTYQAHANPTLMADQLNNDICKLIWQRNSSNNFSSQPLDHAFIAQLSDILAQLTLLFDVTPSIDCYLVVANVEGMAPGLHRFNRTTKSLDFVEQTGMSTSEALYLSCQSQELVKNAAFSIVYAVSDTTAMRLSAQAPLMMNIGYLDACLQLLATHCNIGNSSIGGFSDNCIKLVFRDVSVQPLFMHVFGHTLENIDKFDAAYSHINSESEGK